MQEIPGVLDHRVKHPADIVTLHAEHREFRNHTLRLGNLGEGCAHERMYDGAGFFVGREGECPLLGFLSKGAHMHVIEGFGSGRRHRVVDLLKIRDVQ